LIKKFTNTLGKLFLWLGKRDWRVVISILIIILFFEIFELIHKGDSLFDIFHLIEYAIYCILLIFVAVLVDFYSKAYSAQKYTMDILDYKHQLSLNLLEVDDWEQLIEELVKLPSTIAQVRMSRLYVYSSISNEMEVVSTWKSEDDQDSNFRYDFKKCNHQDLIDNFLFSPNCESDIDENKDEINQLEYCFPISSQKNLLGLIQFQMKSGETLSAEQKEIFNSIRPELGLAYKAAWKHKSLAEMKIVETALAERHSISAFLHDNLSQNLAFIIMKLEQIIEEENLITGMQLRADIDSMKSAAQDSYKIVRGILMDTHPGTTPRLFNLLKEYLKKISSRSEIKTSIEEKGAELSLLPETQKTVFYLFEEALSNVEKHAQARKVDVIVEWGIDRLNLSIKDDGVGFDPKNLDGYDHFGLTIMKERIKNIDGQLDIQSGVDSGTSVIIYVPIESA